MGKVRRLRRKFHLASQKTPAQEEATPVLPVVSSIPGQTKMPVKLNSDSNIFAGITISFSNLQQTLLPPPTSVLGTVSEASDVQDQSSKSTYQSNTNHVPKKDKLRARREALLKKMETMWQIKQEVKKKIKVVKKKEENRFMHMNSLTDALPLLKTGGNKGKSQPDSGTKATKISQVKACLSKKMRRQRFMDDMKVYKSVASNSHFKADPTSAISNYLLCTVSQNSTWVKKT